MWRQFLLATKHSSMTEYNNLRASHAEFDKTVGAIISCVHDNKIEGARKLSCVIKLSNQVVQHSLDCINRNTYAV